MKLANITSVYRAKLIYGAYNKVLSNELSVLDVGCGNGIVTKYLSGKVGFSARGCDIIDYRTEKVMFKKMKSSSKLPYKTNSFDAVMFNDMLHHTHIDNQIKLIHEGLRVADRVLLFEVQPTTVGKIADWVLNKIHNPKMNIPFTFRNTKGWHKLFRKHNIKYKTKFIKTTPLYPFSHVAFFLEKL